jgi:hypothetical protein
LTLPLLKAANSPKPAANEIIAAAVPSEKTERHQLFMPA